MTQLMITGIKAADAAVVSAGAAGVFRPAGIFTGL